MIDRQWIEVCREAETGPFACKWTKRDSREQPTHRPQIRRGLALLCTCRLANALQVWLISGRGRKRGEGPQSDTHAKVVGNDRAKILVDFQIQTDKKVMGTEQDKRGLPE